MKIQTTPFSRSSSRPFGGKKAANPFGKHTNPMAASARVKAGSKPASKRASNPGACCAECAQGNPCNPDTCGTSSNPGRASNVTMVTPGRVGAQLAFNQSMQAPWWGLGWNGWGNWTTPRCYVDAFGQVLCPQPRRVVRAVAVARAPLYMYGGWGGWGNPGAFRGAPAAIVVKG